MHLVIKEEKPHPTDTLLTACNAYIYLRHTKLVLSNLSIIGLYTATIVTWYWIVLYNTGTKSLFLFDSYAYLPKSSGTMDIPGDVDSPAVAETRHVSRHHVSACQAVPTQRNRVFSLPGWPAAQSV